ncbi:TolC family protein [Lignipirellula cremea]|uniref:Outer membrane efflux protein n=1 Tax=Lignipirellula cremea TaxID=2528010 RepID=A0A518DTE5_9BACT|nr:TolC family protein [Lignipirellula cremea]QDU95068.1 hypothetical protein Pla8534_28800 [Lignipirellula cremea]
MHATTLYLALMLTAQVNGPGTQPPSAFGAGAQPAPIQTEPAPSFGGFGSFNGGAPPSRPAEPPAEGPASPPAGSFNPQGPPASGAPLPTIQPMQNPVGAAPGRFEPTPASNPTLPPGNGNPGTQPGAGQSSFGQMNAGQLNSGQINPGQLNTPQRSVSISAPVARTALQQPIAPTEGSLARTLLRQAITPDVVETGGQPLRLLEAIELTTDRTRQLQAVKAYWRLALARADAAHAVQEQTWLSQAPAPQAADQQAQLKAAQYGAAARETEARLALAATQHDFSLAAERRTETPLFVPVDLPFSGEYQTNFRALFSGRVPPAALLRVERTLPGYYELLNIRAEAVESAALALEATDAAYRKGQSNIVDLLTAYEQLQRQRIAFLQAVGDYNYSIADYAMAVAGPNVNRQAVVSMLIETVEAPTATANVTPGLIRRTSGEEPVLAEPPAGIVAPATYEEPAGNPSSGVGRSVLVRENEPTSAATPAGPLTPVFPTGEEPPTLAAPGPVANQQSPEMAPPGEFAPAGEARPLQPE